MAIKDRIRIHIRIEAENRAKLQAWKASHK